MVVDADPELKKFHAAHQPNEVMKTVVAIGELLVQWGKNVEKAGTGDFWDGVISVWSRLDEFLSKEARLGLGRTLDSVNVDKKQKAVILAKFKKMSPGKGAAGLSSFIDSATLGYNVFRQTLAAASDKARYEANLGMLHEIPDAHSAIIWNWRGGDQKIYEKIMGYHAYGEKSREFLADAARPILTLDDIRKLYQRFDWSPEKTKGYLHKLGYPKKETQGADKATTDFVYQLLQPVLPMSDILEMERRGLFDTGELDIHLRRLGHSQNVRNHYTALQRRLLDINEVQECERRGYFKPEDYLERLKQLGYSDADRGILNSLKERIPDFYLSRNLWWRGEIEDEAYTNMLKALGYDDTTAKQIFDISELMPTQQDLVRFGVREIFNPEIRKQYGMDDYWPKAIMPWAKKIGLSEEVMKMYWAAHWQLPSPGQGYEMLHRDIIGEEDLKLLLRALDVMPGWLDNMIKLSYRLIPRRTLPKLVKFGNIGLPELRIRYKNLGFNDDDASILADVDMRSLADEDKQLTKAEVVDDYVYQGSGVGKLRERLTVLGYAGEALDVLVARAQFKKAKYDLSSVRKGEREDAPTAKELTKSEILRMYKESVISAGRATDLLKSINVSDASIGYLIAFANLQHARETREAYAKQVKRLFEWRLVSDTETIKRLTGYGYSDAAAQQLVAFWNVERETDEAINAGKIKRPTKTDLNDWLKKGIIGVDQWMSEFLGLGYSREHTANYLQELAIDIG